MKSREDLSSAVSLLMRELYDSGLGYTQVGRVCGMSASCVRERVLSARGVSASGVAGERLYTSKRYWELHELGGLGYAEIGRHFGVTAASVRGRVLSYGRRLG